MASDLSRRPVELVTHDSIVWEQIPEQTVCICAHPKAVHSRTVVHHDYARVECGGAPRVVRRVPAPESGLGHAPVTIRVKGCECPAFHDVDHPMPWGNFAGRFLGTDADDGQPVADEETLARRRRAALTWAWKRSGLDHQTTRRTWAMWIADSKRVWRAWRAAGSPIVAFGKETSFGPAEIPALEDR